jgi:Flp pilus assembly pilin Flp
VRRAVESRLSDRGATSVEYVLLATFVAIAVAVTIGALGLAALGLFTSGVEEIP